MASGSPRGRPATCVPGGDDLKIVPASGRQRVADSPPPLRVAGERRGRDNAADAHVTMRDGAPRRQAATRSRHPHVAPSRRPPRESSAPGSSAAGLGHGGSKVALISVRSSGCARAGRRRTRDRRDRTGGRGSTVGMAADRDNRRAPGLRAQGMCRLAPVRGACRSAESNACGTVWPASSPASSRTPGPGGEPRDRAGRGEEAASRGPPR